MPGTSEDTIRGLYDAFGRGDIPAIIGTLDEEIDWVSPGNLPHGGHFSGREDVGRFFESIGEHWETLAVDVEQLLSDGDRVVALVSTRGRLRGSGQETGYTAAHAWTVHDGRPMRFAETVDAPLSLPSAATAAA